MSINKTLSIGVGAAALLGIALAAAAVFVSADPCKPGDGRATVQPNGDSVCLQDVATVRFSPGAFAAPTEVTLRATSDRDVAELFEQTTAMFLTAGHADYELRIGTGAAPPQSADVHITMPVPEELLRFTLTGHTLEAFAAIERGRSADTRSSMFEYVESRFDPAAGTVSFQLPAMAFAANELTGGDFQAIVTLAPTLSGANCH